MKNRVRTIVLTVMFTTVSMGLFSCGDTSVDEGPVAVVEGVVEGLKENQPVVLWEALPASYQDDVAEVVHLFAEQMDEELYDRGFALLESVVGVLKSKKEFFLNGPYMTEESNRAEVEAKLEAATGVFDILLDSEISQLAVLKQLDVKRFIQTTGNKLMSHLAEMSKETDDDIQVHLEGFKAELIEKENEEGIVVLRFSMPDEESEEVEFVKVEGKWIPLDLAEEWADGIVEAKANLLKQSDMTDEEKEKSKAQMIGMLMMFEGMVEQVNGINTQEEFDAMIGQLGGMFMMSMMGGNMGQMPMGGDGMPGMMPMAPMTPVAPVQE